MMRFYNQQHRFYCGIDLHARTLSVCILDSDGTAVFHDTLAASPAAFLKVVKPFRQGLVVACECMFAWYWLADLCELEKIPFVLGHALYMKAIHGGKAKTDKIDAKKIVVLLRGGMLHRQPLPGRGRRRDGFRNETLRRAGGCGRFGGRWAGEHRLRERLGRWNGGAGFGRRVHGFLDKERGPSGLVLRLKIPGFPRGC
jgi:transposase